MLDFLSENKDIFIQNADFLIRLFSIFIVSLGVVYLFGRMLGLIQSYRVKNAIAFSIIVGMNIFYELLVKQNKDIVSAIWSIIIYTFLGLVIYVLIGFSLYTRWDKFLDKRFAKSTESKIKIKKPVKKVKAKVRMKVKKNGK